MKQIRILIADDSFKDCQDLTNSLKKYFLAKRISEGDYEIVSTDTIKSSLQVISENNPFDIFFADINFSEKGSEQRNGYVLIREAFKLSPLTYICVYSGIADEDPSLQREYINLLKRGMLADVYKKDFYTGSNQAEFNNRFKKAWNFCKNNQFTWDLWSNHELISSKLENVNLSSNEDIHKNRKGEVENNLDTILFLLKSTHQLSSDTIVYRLCIQIYHRCLEIFVSGDKKEQDLISESDKNKKAAEELLHEASLLGKDRDGIDNPLNLGERSSALRKLVAHSLDDKFKFGYLLNKHRNKSVHSNNIFIPELSNVIFANLTLALYVLDKKEDINISIIKSLSLNKKFQDENERSINDLKNIIEFIGVKN